MYLPPQIDELFLMGFNAEHRHESLLISHDTTDVSQGKCFMLDLDESDFKNINLVHLFETVRYYYSLELLVGVINASDSYVQKEFTEKQSWWKDI